MFKSKRISSLEKDVADLREKLRTHEIKCNKEFSDIYDMVLKIAEAMKDMNNTTKKIVKVVREGK